MAAVSVSSSRCVLSTFSHNYRVILPNVCKTSKNYSTSTSSDEKNYDIVITGGGMVGTTLACALG